MAAIWAGVLPKPRTTSGNPCRIDESAGDLIEQDPQLGGAHRHGVVSLIFSDVDGNINA
jgi:hypothetical protein